MMTPQKNNKDFDFENDHSLSQDRTEYIIRN